MGLLEDLAAQRERELLGLKGMQQSALEEYSNTSGTTGNQALMSALIGLAPLIGGMIRGGRTGLQTGAQLGLMGTEMYSKRLEDEEREEKLRAKAKLDAVNQDVAQKQKELSQIQIKDAEQASKVARGLGPKGTSIVNVLPSAQQPTKLGAADRERLLNESGVIDLLKYNLRAVEKELEVSPELQKKYLREDGSIDYGNAVDVLGEALKAKALGGAKPYGRAVGAWKEFTQTQIRAITGLVSTNNERAAVQEALGKGLLPQDIPTMVENMKRALAKAQFLIAARAQRTYILSQTHTPGDFTAALDNINQQVENAITARFGEESVRDMMADFSSASILPVEESKPGAVETIIDKAGGLLDRSAPTPTPAPPKYSLEALMAEKARRGRR